MEIFTKVKLQATKIKTKIDRKNKNILARLNLRLCTMEEQSIRNTIKDELIWESDSSEWSSWRAPVLLSMSMLLKLG